jgi:hypothetical protein
MQPTPRPRSRGFSKSARRSRGRDAELRCIPSVAAAETRPYRYAGPINHDAIDARVWSGLHFRIADVVGNHKAQAIATLVYRTEFRPAS